MKNIVLSLIRIYQQKPLLFLTGNGISCRFDPSCSEYAYLSIKRYGTIKGFFLSIKRILHCHPFSKGGYDPVK